MIIDLCVNAFRELLKDRKRFLLTVASIVIASTFISLLICTGSTMKERLMSMAVDTSAELNQLDIHAADDHRIMQQESSQLVDSLKANDARVILKVPIVSTTVEVSNCVISKSTVCVYDANYSLFTKGEKRVFKNNYKKDMTLHTGDVFVTQSFLQQNNITALEVKNGDYIDIEILGDNDNRIKKKLKIDGIISNEEMSSMKEKTKADIYMSSAALGCDYSAMSVMSIKLEFDNYHWVSNAQKKVDKKKYTASFDVNRLNEAETESIIYSMIYAIMGGVIICSTIICIFITMSISFGERKEHYGMLKAIGFNKKEIYLLCTFQSVILGGLGGIIGTAISLMSMNVIGKFLIESVLLQTMLDTSAEIHGSFLGMVVTIVIVIVSCLLGSMIPSIRIANSSPIILIREAP